MAFGKALIVDDSKLARVTLRKKLKSHGLEVEVADSADQAYEKIQQFQPEIIFMDHLMPKVDGFEATCHIREQMAVNTPIIMCTGKEHDGYLDEALAIGANYILGKPPVDEQLAAVLSMTFSVPEAASQVAEEQQTDAEADTEETFDFSDVDKALEDLETLTQSLDDEAKQAASVLEQEPLPEPESHASLEAAPALDEEQLRTMIAAQLAREKQEIMTELMAAWTASVDEAPMNETAVEAIVADRLQQQQASMQQQIEQWIDSKLDKHRDGGGVEATAGHASIVAEMEEVLHPRLIELKSSLMADVERKIAGVGGQSLDQDINDFLDLRINVQMADRMKNIDERLEALEQCQPALTTAIDEEGIPVVEDQNQWQSQRFMASETISRQLDQLIEENAQQGRHIRQLRQMVVAALALGSISFVGFAFIFLAGT